MANFQKLFIESKGKPIEYKGKILYLFDKLPIEESTIYLLTFEKTNSEWKQGIALDTEGIIEIENKMFKNKKIILWETTAPKQVKFITHPTKKPCFLFIYNIWDVGDGISQSGYNGAAMIVEEIPNGRRYYCNDGHPDENFDDIVFTRELIRTEQ